VTPAGRVLEFQTYSIMVVMICRELKVPASSMRRLGGVVLTISRRFSGPDGTRQLVIGLSTTVL
jgi:hypothetical protein